MAAPRSTPTAVVPMSARSLTLAWLGFAVLLVAAPLVFRSATAVALLAQMGTAMILGLSYNMLLGQGGMLSFGHAVFPGLGAFMAVHAMNMAGAGQLWLPLPLVPLVGGVTGMVFAALIGRVITRKSGTTFAMITLGIGEMVFASALMFPGFFGGEGGVSTNRVYGEKLFGWNFGSQLQVYGLIAVWLILCAMAIYAFTRTPLGRIINAVRDNAERTAFIGYDPTMARFLTFTLAGFFAGISGALGAINFEVATAENLSAARSGAVLLFTFIGGVGRFIGPMIGAVVGVLMTVLLSDYTPAWPMYLGLLFVLVVVYLPEGLASIGSLLARGLAGHTAARRVQLVAAGAVCGLMAVAGTIVLLEMLYARVSPTGGSATVLGVALDPASLPTWLAGAALLLAGIAGMKAVQRWAAAPSAAALQGRITAAEAA